MWDLLVGFLELFMDSSIDTDALKRHVRADLLPEYRAFKQAQQVQSDAAGLADTHPPTKRPATTRRMSKRTRRPDIPPHT